MNPTILIIEDDEAISQTVERALTRQGYQVLSAADGDEGLALARSAKPDLILLDLMLPGLDGFEITRRLRRDGEGALVPILMMTARRQDEDLVSGLSAGADDYIKKPFSLAELTARVAAHLRRGQRDHPAKELHGLVLNDEERRATFQGRPLPLSPTEYDLLRLLARQAGHVVPRGRLMNLLFGLDDGESRSLDSHVARLRKKLEGPGMPIIVTHRARGYELLLEEKE